LRIGVQYQSHARYDTTVSRLVLVISDLPLARPDESARAALPRMPQLEQWLAAGDSEPVEGWRPWLQRALLAGDQRVLPLASIAAAVLPDLPVALPLWLATPVHLVVGLDTVRVHPAGVLRLTWDEQRALEHDFASVFAGSGWSLHATGRRELLLAGGAPQPNGTVRSHDPQLWLGVDPRAGLPAGPGAAPLRRLGAEIEMWLHEHQVNQQRLARGQLSASGFWIWGGGGGARFAPAVPSSAGHVAWGDDLYLDGLARIGGYRVEPLPEHWPPQASSAAAPGADRLVVCELGPAPDLRSLELLDQNWIAPALELWRRGGVQRATLLAGGRAVTLAHAPLRSLWRRLRRIRPWWESFGPC
jgi:hypothetical protein